VDFLVLLNVHILFQESLSNTPSDSMASQSNSENAKKALIESGESWDENWQTVLDRDPAILEAFVKWKSPALKNRHLSPKIQQLIYIAVDAAATHLHRPGIQAHIQAAIREGATGDEIMEVLELTSTLGIHSCNIGVPLLFEVLKEAGLRDGTRPLDKRREHLKAEFTKNRGYWHPFWEEILDLDPDFFEGYIEFSSVPWKKGPLEPKVKELVYCAFDCAATHLYVPGLKLHMKNAIGYGATAEEIMEVLEIASYLSMHTITTATPILADELRRSSQN